MKTQVAVMASGEGTNLQSLIDSVHGKEVEIACVVSDKPDAHALERAAAAGIATKVFSAGEFADRETRDAAIATWLQELDVKFVVLGGYMAILCQAFVDDFEDRIINVHPSLLPAFAGIRSVERAVEKGVEVFGVTVHLVDGGVDTGPIIMQEAIRLPGVRDPALVRTALQPIEHRLLPEAVRIAAAVGGFKRDPQNPQRLLLG